jgi:hypothetical protein
MEKAATVVALQALPHWLVTEIVTWLDATSHARCGLVNKRLQEIAKQENSWCLRMRVLGCLYGMRVYKQCDWNKAERLLLEAKQTPEVIGLQGLLARERAGRDKVPSGPLLRREALRLWETAAKLGDWWSQFWLLEEAFHAAPVSSQSCGASGSGCHESLHRRQPCSFGPPMQAESPRLCTFDALVRSSCR